MSTDLRSWQAVCHVCGLASTQAAYESSSARITPGVGNGEAKRRAD